MSVSTPILTVLSVSCWADAGAAIAATARTAAHNTRFISSPPRALLLSQA